MVLPIAVAATTITSMIPRSCYVHVPFCVHRCGYCDFTLVAGRDDLIGPYLEGIGRELRFVLGEPVERLELDTFYWGGGTPSYLNPDQLRQLNQTLRSRFELAADAEFTVEANPHGLDESRIQTLADLGCNRISLGVQSFDANVLKTLERDHSPEDIQTVVQRLRSRIDNFSIDLIFGVPGQTLDSYRTTLEQAIDLAPRHLSTYGLTFEKGTTFWSRREHGSLQQVDEELERDLYALTIERLEAAGYRQYEVSSFAQPGFESRHNQVYWSGKPYHAFGPGASRYLNGRRDNNHRSLFTWLKRLQDNASPVGESETLSPEDRARELMILGLRQIKGVSHAKFEELTGFAPKTLMGKYFSTHRDNGLIEDDGHDVKITPAGRFIADSIVVDYLRTD
ncbi:radical SAM family heme chaperone HemW [Planctomycetaceae bacterium SH248]